MSTRLRIYNPDGEFRATWDGQEWVFPSLGYVEIPAGLWHAIQGLDLAVLEPGSGPSTAAPEPEGGEPA
jgi:hypothetical protein